MSSTTTNLGLVKMASGETIGQWSDANNGSGANLDKIDTAIGNLNSQIVPMQKKTATATTSATGSINLSTAFSVYAGAYSLVNLYAESSDYPNGLIAKEVKLGTSYYAIITDTTGAVVASKSVNLSAIVANIGFA